MSIQPQSTIARTKFIVPNELIEGTITQVNINTDPFHCTIRITPENPILIPAEGRYSSNELSLGKLRRNLVHLQFKIIDLEDVLAAVESLENRKCVFRIDRSGWISWIIKLTPLSLIKTEDILKPLKEAPTENRREIFFIREKGMKSIYQMQYDDGTIVAYALGPTDRRKPNPHGWLLNIPTLEVAQFELAKRKV